MALFKQLANIIKRLLKYWRALVLLEAVSTHASVKKSAKGIVYVALYVDDNLMVGNIAAIGDAIEALSKGTDTKNHGRAAGLFVMQNQIFRP